MKKSLIVNLMSFVFILGIGIGTYRWPCDLSLKWIGVLLVGLGVVYGLLCRRGQAPKGDCPQVLHKCSQVEHNDTEIASSPSASRNDTTRGHCEGLPKPAAILRFVVLGILFLLLGYGYVMIWRQLNIDLFSYGESKVYRGLVCEEPDRRSDKIYLTICVYQPKFKSRLQVKMGRYPDAWKYGDFIEFKGVVEKPEKIEGFNYPLYLERYKINGLVRKPESVKVLLRERGSPVKKGFIGIKNNAERLINQYIPEPESSFLSGILIGSRRSIPEEVQADLKTTGTTHMVAVSGANITILLGILEGVLPIYSLTWRFYMIAASAIFVSVLTGLSASVLRGAVVVVLMSYLRMRGRRAWATPVLIVTMLLLILGNPLMLMGDPGFQLSMGAFAGLMYTEPTRLWIWGKLSEWIKNKYSWNINFNNEFWTGLNEVKIYSELKSVFKETVAATIGTYPISVIQFGGSSLWGLIVNPIVLWLLPAITAFGLILLAGFWMPEWFVKWIVSFPLWFMLRSVLRVIGMFANAVG